ncbi:MAG: metallophosphoesterase [Clostridia bacterium]|nr:metallophosphoesterase [Clostridia bacterium]
MVMRTVFQKFFYWLFGVFMALVLALNGGYVPPSTETPIDTSKEDAKADFAILADPQISNYMLGRYPIYTAACEDLHNAECKFDAVIGVGDIAENGLSVEYQLIYDKLHGLDTRYIMAAGNHDIRLRIYKQSLNTFSYFVNTLNGDESMDSFHFSEVINGYKIIVVGSDKTEFESSYLSDEQLQWIDSEIAAENGKPVFVIAHQPLKDSHNIEQAWGSSIKTGASVGEQSEELQAIMSKYKNVFFISGHLHSGFGPDNYNNIDGIHSINAPSMTIENKDGTYNEAGLGFILEVYEDEVIFRARNMAKGVWVAEETGDSSYDIVIPVEK